MRHPRRAGQRVTAHQRPPGERHRGHHQQHPRQQLPAGQARLDQGAPDRGERDVAARRPGLVVGVGPRPQVRGHQHDQRPHRPAQQPPPGQVATARGRPAGRPPPPRRRAASCRRPPPAPPPPTAGAAGPAAGSRAPRPRRGRRRGHRPGRRSAAAGWRSTAAAARARRAGSRTARPQPAALASHASSSSSLPAQHRGAHRVPAHQGGQRPCAAPRPARTPTSSSARVAHGGGDRVVPAGEGVRRLGVGVAAQGRDPPVGGVAEVVGGTRPAASSGERRGRRRARPGRNRRGRHPRPRARQPASARPPASRDTASRALTRAEEGRRPRSRGPAPRGARRRRRGRRARPRPSRAATAAAGPRGPRGTQRGVAGGLDRSATGGATDRVGEAAPAQGQGDVAVLRRAVQLGAPVGAGDPVVQVAGHLLDPEARPAAGRSSAPSPRPSPGQRQRRLERGAGQAAHARQRLLRRPARGGRVPRRASPTTSPRPPPAVDWRGRTAIVMSASPASTGSVSGAVCDGAVGEVGVDEEQRAGAQPLARAGRLELPRRRGRRSASPRPCRGCGRGRRRGPPRRGRPWRWRRASRRRRRRRGRRPPASGRRARWRRCAPARPWPG